jgi:hypothetical protein
MFILNTMKKKLVGLLLFLSAFGSIKAQEKTPILLNDPQLQFEITESVNALYDFKFEKADSAFHIFKNKYKNHPLPYFLLGYSQYWRMQPNDNIKIFDRKFYSYMDTVIHLSEKLYDTDNKNYEAIFFLTAAYAFKGRIASERKEWLTATNAGRLSLKYLDKSEDFNDLSPEFLFGRGLYNYFRQWIPDNYKGFKPVMWFFPKGDKEKGIQYLKQCAENAFYTRIEAQFYLVIVYLFEEKKAQEAYSYAKNLHELYPNNPVFHRMYARILFTLGKSNECLAESKKILDKIDAKTLGYEEISGRYATFYLGYYSKWADPIKAKGYFLRTVAFSEKIGATKMNYYLYALQELAEMAKKDNDKANALLYNQKIKDNADKNHDLYKSARKYVREND